VLSWDSQNSFLSIRSEGSALSDGSNYSILSHHADRSVLDRPFSLGVTKKSSR
jgi:hypothetical protein